VYLIQKTREDGKMSVGRLLVIAGLLLVVLGLLLILGSKLNLPLGRLPGDVVWRGKNTTIIFPWVTCLVISTLGTLLLWLIAGRR
jgi:hypothetical protein